MSNLRALLVLGLAAVFFSLVFVRAGALNNQTASSGQTPAQPSPTPPTQVETQQHSYFDATSKWPSPRIYVCWENPTQADQKAMDLVRKSVAESWEAASAVRFTGWQKCAAVNRGIRILIDDQGPHTMGLGSRIDGKRAGMVLNFSFNNWSTPCKQQWDFCVRTIAVHEFGHALGFAHEHNRPDRPGECQELKQGTDGTVMLTPYDPQSVMNYCNKEYSNNGILSKYDTEAVQKIYGLPPKVSPAKIPKTP